ncbi:MAG: type II toxin-antitoxin system HicA family toxin [Deltaproteobacteria bacterium]|nr:type II toxin-antitoxin system HicA family toxin [Deltaproteobacteria bacterium]
MGLRWPSMKARQLLAALLRAGWTVKRETGSHRWLRHPVGGAYVFAFHDAQEVPGRLVKQVAKATGLRREDL